MDDYKIVIIRLVNNIDDSDIKFLKKIYTLINNHLRKKNRRT